MNNKATRKKFIISNFINATKKIIEEEGITSVTARKIGDISGYSYATIYNYFSDLKELLAYCALDYLDECYFNMLKIDTKELPIPIRIEKHAEAYFDYFAKKPEIFKLIFLEDIENYAIKLSKDSKKPRTSFLLKNLLKEAALNKIINKKDIETIHGIIVSSIHGKLLFLIKKRDNKSLDEIKITLSNEINILFN